MKNIILPTDFSACADNALRYAINLAQLMGAKLNVVYVHRPDVVIQSMPMSVPTEQLVPVPKEVKDKMATLKTLLSSYPTLKFECHINEGMFDDVIISIAEKHKDAIIVMGTEGAHDKLAVFMGSNTSRIAERRILPVLAIPANYKGVLENQSEFVFATDFENINNWDVMDVFKSLAQKIHATINVFYVRDHFLEKQYADVQKMTYDRLKEYFSGINVELHYSNKDNIIKAIEAFSKHKKVSLTMMIAHERGFLDDLFHKSVTKEMTLYTHIPFLAIPDAKLDKNLAANINYW